MSLHFFPRREIELLALRAMAGERVSLLLGRRHLTLTVDPVFRVRDSGDGFLYLCSGIEALKQRLETVAFMFQHDTRRAHSELGGARGPR